MKNLASLAVFVLAVMSSSNALSASASKMSKSTIQEDDQSISSIVDGTRFLRANDEKDHVDDEERSLTDALRTKLDALDTLAGKKLRKLDIKLGEQYNRLSLELVHLRSRNKLQKIENAKKLIEDGKSFAVLYKEGVTPDIYMEAKGFGKAFKNVLDTKENRRKEPRLISWFEYKKFYNEQKANDATKLRKFFRRKNAAADE